MVERALYLDEPDDRGDHEERAGEEPEAGPAADRRRLPVSCVHASDLRGDHVPADGIDDDPDHEPDHAADTGPGSVLQLVLCLVRPVPAVEAERHDEEQDPET